MRGHWHATGLVISRGLVTRGSQKHAPRRFVKSVVAMVGSPRLVSWRSFRTAHGMNLVRATMGDTLAVLPEVMLSERLWLTSGCFWYWQPSRPWVTWHTSRVGCRAFPARRPHLLSPRWVSRFIAPKGRGISFTAMRVFPDHWRAIHIDNTEFPLPSQFLTRRAPIWRRFTPVPIRWRFHRPLLRALLRRSPRRDQSSRFPRTSRVAGKPI